MNKECMKLEKIIYWSKLEDVTEMIVLHEKNIENERKILQNMYKLRDLYIKKQSDIEQELTYTANKNGKN